jgi:hypothetical protein
MHLCPTSRDGAGGQPFGRCVDRTFVLRSILNDTLSTPPVFIVLRLPSEAAP